MEDWNWFSINWLNPETLGGFEWKHPLVLWAGLVIPFLFVLRKLFFAKFRQRLAVAVPQGEVKSSPLVWLRFLPPFLLTLSFLFLIVALARPQKTNDQVEQWAEGIDIMLVLDISESMRLKDFRPNRMEATKKVAGDFIAGRFQDRIGLVIFSGDALSYAPLTTDYDMLQSLIESIDFAMIPKGGTAIGSAIAVGVNRMTESTSESKVMIVLSDGENNAGSIDPVTSAKLAYAYGIKLYSIGVGKQGKVLVGKDMFGNPQYAENRLDEAMLTEIATIGNGKYYQATNQDALSDVFKQIDKLEKTEIKETRYKDTKDYYFQYLAFGMLFFLLWLATKSTFLANALED